MVDVSTVNTIVSRSGTGFTIDVTACNLDTDLTVRDFIIIQAGVLTSNVNYQKTSRTVLTYIGASLPVTTIQVRRKTPVDVIQTITFASRFNSALWNSELERNARWKAETELNGSGVTGIGVPVPDNSAYSVFWGSDIIYPPTRQAVYNKIETLAPLASPALTGTPTVPNIASVVSNQTIPNTKYVGDNYAPLASPNLTGTPTAPTRTFGDSSISLATTAYVQAAQTPHRVTQTVAARASSAIGTGIVDLVTINVTLPRANPVRCSFSIYTAGSWSGSSSAAVISGTWVYKVNGITVSEQNAVNGQASSPLYSPFAESHLLPYALTTTTFPVVLATRYNVATNINWNAFTWVVDFFWS